MLNTYRKPPMEHSEEAEPNELDMARVQGEIYTRALEHMVNNVADDGGEVHAGDYIVAYAVEAAEGMYHMENGDLVMHEPDAENIHIEVSVRDGADNRFIPNLNIRVTLIDPDGNEVGTHEQPFVWHPWLYHYGRNWQVAQSGTYTMRVHINAPDFPRHDEINGKRYATDVDVEFDDVKIKIAKQSTKEQQPMQKQNSDVQIWISPFNDNWKVHQSNTDAVISVKDTQAEAIEVGRQIAKKVGGELIIQDEDGQIRERNSYGADPYPPKG